MVFLIDISIVILIMLLSWPSYAELHETKMMNLWG